MNFTNGKEFNYLNYNLFQVTFDIGIPKHIQSAEAFRQMMAVYVTSKFDLPACRVAAIISMQKELPLAYIINASGLNIHKTPTSEERRLKYEARKVKNKFVTVPLLQLCTSLGLFNKLT